MNGIDIDTHCSYILLDIVGFPRNMITSHFTLRRLLFLVEAASRCSSCSRHPPKPLSFCRQQQ